MAFAHLGIELTDQLTVKTARDLKRCTRVIQDFVLDRLNQAIASRLSSSFSVLHEDYVGTLTRCLQNLEQAKDDDEAGLSASKALQEVDPFDSSITGTSDERAKTNRVALINVRRCSLTVCYRSFNLPIK